MDKEKIEEAKEYRKLYETLKGESEQEIDKYIRYLAGGALVISLTFMKEIIPTEGKSEFLWLIITGWFMLIASLLSNFVSYFYTIRNTDKTIEDIDDENEHWVEEAKKRNAPIVWINRFSAASCISGIILITLFVTLNICNMDKKITPPKPKTVVIISNESKTIPTPKTETNSGDKTSKNSTAIEKKETKQ